MKELTIQQFAKKHGKSVDAVESQIRRKRLKARKFGKMWALPADQGWPEDRRFKAKSKR